MCALCISLRHPHHPHHPHTDGSDTESGEEGDDGVGGGGGGGGTVADNPLASLKEKLRELSTAHDLVVKNCHQVMKLIPTEVVEEGGGGGGRGNGGGGSKLKEKLTMFKITANAMAKVLYKFPFISQLQLNYTHSTLLSHFTISM